ncbi:Mce-associated membrane protein [Marmoricola sp. URHA0025 HA25]
MTNAPSGTTRGFLALALVVLTALGVLVAGVLVYRAYHPTDEPLSLSNSGQPIPSSSTRHQVVAVAEQFCLRMDAVDGSDVAGYKKKVSQLLTTKQKAKFDSSFAEFEKLGISKELKGTGTILSSGVSELDADSATVLVAHDSTLKDTSGTTDRHYRWTVALRKVHGDWLVDDFTPVS